MSHAKGFTLTELRKAADHLPKGEPRAPYHRVAISRMEEALHYRPDDPCFMMDRPIDCAYIEFRCDQTKVNGLPAWAWYYQDLLIKVVV